jgi:hypothetical protein
VLGAHIHVNLGVREWMCLNVRETTCESVCVGCKYTCECGCSWMDVVECARICM